MPRELARAFGGWAQIASATLDLEETRNLDDAVAAALKEPGHGG